MEVNLPTDESDLVLNLPANTYIDEEEIQKEVFENSNKLQRTKEWFENRNKKWTGSKRKDLMSCNSKGGKLSWHNEEKIFMFSDGAIKTIYNVAMQRRTGKIMKNSSTKQMDYGTKIEPLIFIVVERYCNEHYAAMTVKQVGFKDSEENENSGSSSDGLIYDDLKKEPVASIEIKACCSWDSHYDRTFEPVDEKSIDFWQSQAQMEAWGVPFTLYAVAEPPEDIMVYLKSENIEEYSEQWEKECPVTFQKVLKSPIHQRAMSIRIAIAESVISEWNKKGGSLKEIFYNELSRYKTDHFKNAEKLGVPIGAEQNPVITYFEQAIKKEAEKPNENQLIETTEELKLIPVYHEEVSEVKNLSFDEINDDLPF